MGVLISVLSLLLHAQKQLLHKSFIWSLLVSGQEEEFITVTSASPKTRGHCAGKD